MRWVVNSTPRSLYPRERDPVPIVQEAGWAPGPVWTGAENIAPNGIRSPDRTARSESLYRLRYPGPLRYKVPFLISALPYHPITFFVCFLPKITVPAFNLLRRCEREANTMCYNKKPLIRSEKPACSNKPSFLCAKCLRYLSSCLKALHNFSNTYIRWRRFRLTWHVICVRVFFFALCIQWNEDVFFRMV